MKFSIAGLLFLSGVCFAEVSSDVVAEYLERIGFGFEQIENEFMVYMEDEEGTAWPVLYIGIQPDIEACYMATFTPAVVPASGQVRIDALEKICLLNWNTIFGKYEINPETGEVSVSYVFSTENGIGFEAFEAVISVLFAIIEEDMEILSGIS